MPTREQNGRTILDIYAHFHSGAGDVLRANNFVAVAARQRIPMADIREGLEYAASALWIEETPNGSLRLTQQGEAAQQGQSHT